MDTQDANFCRNKGILPLVSLYRILINVGRTPCISQLMYIMLPFMGVSQMYVFADFCKCEYALKWVVFLSLCTTIIRNSFAKPFSENCPVVKLNANKLGQNKIYYMTTR